MNRGARRKLWPFYALIGLGLLALAITVAENSTGLSLGGTVYAVEAGSPVEGARKSDPVSAAAQGAPKLEEVESAELESESQDDSSGISDRIIRQRDMLGTLRSREKNLEAREEALKKERENLLKTSAELSRNLVGLEGADQELHWIRDYLMP